MEKRIMHPVRQRAPRLWPLLLPFTALAACELSNPAEVRTNAETFPLGSNWSASATPVGTGAVRATLSIKQYLGYRLGTTLQFTGAPATTYQWRIFRGDCATTAVAVNNTAPTGLLLFATVLSYPDVVTDAAGTATVTRDVAGLLDSLKTYSVRVRVAQTSTAWNGTSPVACGDLQRTGGG